MVDLERLNTDRRRLYRAVLAVSMGEPIRDGHHSVRASTPAKPRSHGSELKKRLKRSKKGYLGVRSLLQEFVTFRLDAGMITLKSSAGEPINKSQRARR